MKFQDANGGELEVEDSLMGRDSYYYIPSQMLTVNKTFVHQHFKRVLGVGDTAKWGTEPITILGFHGEYAWIVGATGSPRTVRRTELK